MFILRIYVKYLQGVNKSCSDVLMQCVCSMCFQNFELCLKVMICMYTVSQKITIL